MTTTLAQLTNEQLRPVLNVMATLLNPGTRIDQILQGLRCPGCGAKESTTCYAMPRSSRSRSIMLSFDCRACSAWRVPIEWSGPYIQKLLTKHGDEQDVLDAIYARYKERHL